MTHSPPPPRGHSRAASARRFRPLWGPKCRGGMGAFPRLSWRGWSVSPPRYKGCCVAEHGPRQHSDAPGPRAGQQVRSALQQEPPLPVLPRRVSICTICPVQRVGPLPPRGSRSELPPEGLQPAAFPRAPPGLLPFPVLPDSSVPAPAVLGGARGPQGLTSRDAGLVTGCRGCRDCRG